MAITRTSLTFFDHPVDATSTRLRGEIAVGTIQGPVFGKASLAYFAPFITAAPPTSTRDVGLGRAIESLDTLNDNVDWVVDIRAMDPFEARSAMTWSRVGTPIIVWVIFDGMVMEAVNNDIARSMGTILLGQDLTWGMCAFQYIVEPERLPIPLMQ